MSSSVRPPGDDLPSISENGVLDILFGLLKEPLIIASISALIGVIFAFGGQLLLDTYKAKNARYHTLQIVREALLNNKKTFC